MSKHSIFFLFTFFLLSCLGCDRLLEESPDTFLSEGQVFNSEENLEQAVNGIYHSITSFNYYGARFHNLVMPVSGKFWSSQNANVDATQLNTTASNINLTGLWAEMYSAINQANIVITNLTEDQSLSNRDNALGEAHFYRGMVYFDLVRFFGGVPLRTEPAMVSRLDLPRASAAEVWEQVISDFTMAGDLLPRENENARPNDLVARAYLAKVYLTLAAAANDRSNYEKAKTEALAVVESGVYQLVPTYAELFTPGNENTTESIFELQYGNTGGARNADFVRNYVPRNSEFAPPNIPTFGRIRPNKQTYDDHVATYPDDPRIAATFVADQYLKQNGRPQRIYPRNTSGNNGFTVLAKYFDPTYNGTTTNRNMLLYRYADVLLLLAEVENELNGPDAAYAYVNQVLARARDTDGDGSADTAEPANYTNLNQAEFRLRIRRERIFELLGEGHAWFDTRRYGWDYLLENVIRPHNNNPNLDPNKDFVYPEDAKNLLLPIPLNELSGNQEIDVSDQNPGY